MERMYVDAVVWDAFVPRFVRAARSLRLGQEAVLTVIDDLQWVGGTLSTALLFALRR
jgi:hypothetical protein